MANTRSLVLLTALGLTLAATWYAAGIEGEDEAAGAADELLARPTPIDRNRDRDGNGANGLVRDAATNATDVAAVVTATPATPARPNASGQRMSAGSANLFAVRSWQPPPPPPRPVAAVQDLAPPSAPPLPFRYLGRMEDGGRITVFLGEGAQTVRVVRQGDQLSDYRIDEISAQGMRLTYLPLQQPQQLLFGSPN